MTASLKWTVKHNVILLLLALFGQKMATAQCDYTAPATVVLNHQSFTVGSTVQYYLVGSDGKIKYISTTPNIANVASGAYKAYAFVGDASSTLPNATVGVLWLDVAQNCMLQKASTIYVCDNCSGLLTWAATSTGSQNSGFTNSYALVNTATGNIEAVSGSPAFASPFNGDTYQLWAFNYAGTATGYTVGSPIAGAGSSLGCADKISGPVYRACYDFSNLQLTGAPTVWPDAFATIASRGHVVWLGSDADKPSIEFGGYNGGTDANTSGLNITQTGLPLPGGNGTSATPFVLTVSGPTDIFEFNITVNGTNGTGGMGNNVYWAIWYDANNNGSFTDVDDVFATGVKEHGSPVTQTVPFTLVSNGANAGALQGKIRAVATAVSTTFTKAQNGVAQLTNGEVEDYYVAYSTVLPVSLLSFEAVKKDRNVLVSWQTASEQNTSQFIIERGTTGQVGWQAIGSVAAAGTSSRAISYSFKDVRPGKGVNFYRLRIVNSDGSYTTSVIRSLYFDPRLEIQIMPNPASNYIVLSGLASKVQLQLYDGKGSLVQQHTTFARQQKINIAGFAAGSYLVRVLQNGKVIYMGKFIKQ